MLPKVSILIPCYNTEQWIAQAIKSALEQTYPNKEVIVVDDGSRDNSLKIIKSFEGKIRWETQTNQGGNITRNRLLDISTGEWLQYLDSDDYLRPDKIEKQVQFLQNVPQADIIYSPSILEIYDEQNSYQKIFPIPEPRDPWILLARWYLPQTGSPLWRKSAIMEVGKWKPDQPCCQEHELYLRLLIQGKRFEYFAEAGSIYRQWSEATLCKRNMPETYRKRLEITDRAESSLEAAGELTPERQNAINQARFECARGIWLFDTEWAQSLIAKIRDRDPKFSPYGSAAPQLYQLTYHWLGFSFSENVALLKRKVGSFIRSTL